MVYFKDTNGLVFAYETLTEREQFGAADLVAMSEAEVAAHTAPPEPANPTVVTMRQARLALLANGLLAQVETAINGLPSPQKEAARIEWDYSSEVHRDKPFVQSLAAALSLTPAQLDALFVQAAAL